MWARSQTSGLMIGSTWRSSAASSRCATIARVRSRTCVSASRRGTAIADGVRVQATDASLQATWGYPYLQDAGWSDGAVRPARRIFRHALEHVRCPRWALEREEPQEGDLGMAGLRRHRLRFRNPIGLKSADS